jgi:hypothetical protein
MDADADSDPAIFVIDLQGANKKTNLKKSFSAYYFLNVHIHNISKIKSHKTVGIKFFLLFLPDDRRIQSGSVPLTNGYVSGSKRPKNIRIRRIRIRIRNTGFYNTKVLFYESNEKRKVYPMFSIRRSNEREIRFMIRKILTNPDPHQG